MKLKGLLFRKIKELTEEDKKKLDLPGFRLKEVKHIVEIPSFKNEREVNVIYPLIELFAYAHIHWDDASKQVIYEVIEPELSKEEVKKLERIKDGLLDLIDVELSNIKDFDKAMEYLQNQVKKVIEEYGIDITPAEYVKIMYYVYRDFVGLGKIEPLMKDPNIEDIGCDGVGIPIYVVHRKFGSIKTNIVFDSHEELSKFVIKLAEKCGRYVSYAEPILDGTLPDGSRVSATLAHDVATKGPTFSIRKFREKPFSPVEQILLHTASIDIMAYFWYLVEHRASFLIAGGVASGKTSMLNTISMFIPPEKKIVSIEDTRELQLPHEHWVPVVTRTGFGIPLLTGEKYGEITLFDLLKESFRQNPDYVIVGEVRGEEAYVMFQGMASGNTCWGTFHAGSVDAIVKRLITPPIQLPPSLVEVLDCIVLMTHAREKGKSARRVKEVFEIEEVEEDGSVKGVVVFEWDAIKDEFVKKGKSIVVEKLAKASGETPEQALREIETRKKVLEWMVKNNVKDYREVYEIIVSYYKDKKALLERLGIEEIKEVQEFVGKEEVTVTPTVKRGSRENDEKSEVSYVSTVAGKTPTIVSVPTSGNAFAEENKVTGEPAKKKLDAKKLAEEFGLVFITE